MSELKDIAWNEMVQIGHPTGPDMVANIALHHPKPDPELSLLPVHIKPKTIMGCSSHAAIQALYIPIFGSYSICIHGKIL